MELHCCHNASLHTAPIKRSHFRFSKLDEIPDILERITAHCPDQSALSQGLLELMVNAVEHGNLGITYDEKSALLLSGEWHEEIARRLALPENQSKYVSVDCASCDEYIAVLICDQGKGFDWRLYMEFSPERSLAPNGRGITITKSLGAWDIAYQGKGNEVLCRAHK